MDEAEIEEMYHKTAKGYTGCIGQDLINGEKKCTDWVCSSRDAWHWYPEFFKQKKEFKNTRKQSISKHKRREGK